MKGVCGRILKGYFGRQLLQAISDTAVFEMLIEEKLPEIHHHFKKHNGLFIIQRLLVLV
jgi:hypothetical protein